MRCDKVTRMRCYTIELLSNIVLFDQELLKFPSLQRLGKILFLNTFLKTSKNPRLHEISRALYFYMKEHCSAVLSFKYKTLLMRMYYAV